MEITFENQPLAGIAADVLILAVAESSGEPNLPAGLDKAVQSWAGELYASGEFKGKLYELATLHKPAGLKAKRLLLVGTGKENKSADDLRFAVGAAIRNTKKYSPAVAAVWIGDANPQSVAAVTEGAIFGNWESDCYKSTQDRKPIGSCSIVVGESSGDLERSGAHV